MEGPALPRPLRAGSFPLRWCRSCAIDGEDFRGDAVTSISVRLPQPPCQAKQPSFSHRYMYVGISKVRVLDLALRSRKLDFLLPVVFPPREGSLIRTSSACWSPQPMNLLPVLYVTGFL